MRVEGFWDQMVLSELSFLSLGVSTFLLKIGKKEWKKYPRLSLTLIILIEGKFNQGMII